MKNQYLRVPYGMTVHGDKEIAAVNRVLKSSTQMGSNTNKFENLIANEFGHEYGIGVNSGSSALYLAMEILNLPKNSEVITPALTFATTVGCIVKNGLIPCFIDVEERSLLIDIDKIERNINENTSAMCIPNLMGNLPDWEKINQLAVKYDLKVLEDSADIIGSRYKGEKTGKFADITITSFYGMHIINCAGNGGMICTSKKEYADKAKLLRSWGRSSSLFDDSEAIENRFNVKVDNIDYDAKFIFEEIGYNLEPSELGSAFGIVQYERLQENLNKRKNVYAKLEQYFTKFSEWIDLPSKRNDVDSVWFAFPFFIKKNAPFSRKDLMIFFEEHNIQTRVIFTGNITRQPGFKNIEKKIDKDGLMSSDMIMRNGMLIACHHGMTDEMIEHIIMTFNKFKSKFDK